MTREDPKAPRASQWLSKSAKGNFEAFLTVIGVPLHCAAAPNAPHGGPPAIRAALQHFQLYDVETGADLERIGVRDVGDIPLPNNSPEGNFFRCVDVMKRSHTGDATVLLGGDECITRPGVHSLGFPLERCGLLSFDAHFDLGGLEHGLTSNNTMRALLRDGLPGENIAQIGLQPFANSAIYAQIAREAGMHIVTADEVYLRGIHHVVEQALAQLAQRADALYVNLDLDVLDRAFAPACADSRPGGLQPWMLRQAIRRCGQHERVLMMDIVDLDPKNDLADTTALAAASFLLAFAAGMASCIH